MTPLWIASAAGSGAALLALYVATRAMKQSQAPARRRADVMDIRSSLVHLRDELSALAMQAQGEIDDKMRALRELLGEADRHAEEIRQLLARSDACRASETAIDSDGVAAVRAIVAADDVDADTARDDAAARRDAILELAALGLSLTEIASETNTHRGEVELLLSLHRSRSRGDTPAVSADAARIDRTRPTATPRLRTDVAAPA